MAETSPADRLRAFVAERVRREGKHYIRGVGAALAKHLQRPSSWVSEYTDDPPLRHADLDIASEICAFFNVDLMQFVRGETPHSPPALTADEQAALRLSQAWLRIPNGELREELRRMVDVVSTATGNQSAEAPASDTPRAVRRAGGRRRKQ